MKFYEIIMPIHLNTIQTCSLIFIMCIVSVKAIYRDPPPYFNSFYCNLGEKTMADSGDYTCTSPKVIERADAFALSLVEFNKVALIDIWFHAQIISGPGVNLTSINIRLQFKTAYTTKFGYMVVVIGYQPQSTWIDVISVKLPADPAQTQVQLPNTVLAFKYQTFAIPFPARVAAFGYIDKAEAFLTSFGISSSLERYYAHLNVTVIFRPVSNPPSTDFDVRIFASEIQTLKTINYGVLIWMTPNKPQDIELKMKYDGWDRYLAYVVSNDPSQIEGFAQSQLYIGMEFFGPSFNRKCLIMNKQINYVTDIRIELFTSRLFNYVIYKVYGTNVASTLHNFFCIAMTTVRELGQFDYLDRQTGQIYTFGYQCPVPINNFSFWQKNYCPKCSQPECIRCNSSSRSQCYECDPTSLTYVSPNKMCECIDWHIRTNSNSPCRPCIKNCLVCVTSACPGCKVGYGVTVSGQCTKCSSLYPNCSKCLRQLQGCTQCDTTKNYILHKGQCYYIPGCSSYFVVNGTATCLACSLLYSEYNQNSSKCICQKGFYFNDTDEVCVQKCGDGIKVLLEECDDGNLINGDGCDEFCQEETNFTCYENNASKTLCTFSQNVLITLDRIMKVENENVAEIYFNIDPAPSSLYYIDWTQTIKFSFSDTIRKPTVSFSYNNGVLTAKLTYFDDIEGSSCRVEVKYNSSIIDSDPQFFDFELQGLNDKLLYRSEILGESQKIVSISSFAVGIAALFCFIFSCYYHKLIGLETLQFIQLIYFLRIIFTDSSQPNVLAFNSLKYSNGYNQIPLPGQNQQNELKSIPLIFRKIQFHLYYLQNCNFMIIPILLATLAYVAYLFLSSRAHSHYLKHNEVSRKDKFISLRRKVDWIYDNFIFSYSLSLLYITVFQMLVYQLSDLSTHNKTNQIYVQISFGLNLVILFYVLAIFCSQTIQGFKRYIDGLNNKENHFTGDKAMRHEASKDYHHLYVPFYLLYQLSLIVLINSTLLEFTYLTETMIGLAFIYSIIFFAWKPYVLNIHNYTNIYNQGVVLLFLTQQVLGKYDLLNSTLEIICLYITITLIVLALILQLVRVYVYKKSLQRAFKVEKQNKKVDSKQQKQSLGNNPYILKNQLSKKKNLKGIQIEQPIEYDESTILGREMLRKKLRQQSNIKEESRKRLDQIQQVDEDKDALRRIKQKLRKGLKYHEQWIFK